MEARPGITTGWALALWVSMVAVSGCADSQSDMAMNEEFKIWCGDNPCAWTVEEGEVAPASTWHRSAPGIGFNSDPARISQVISLEDVACLTIATLGAVEGNARFFWNLDYGNDGPPDGDVEIEIPFGDWKKVHREAVVPDGTAEVRLILEKRGPGRAVLASAYFFASHDCIRDAAPD